MATLQLLRRENSGVVYANSSNPSQTVRFRNTTSNKTLNGVSVKNHLLEIIYNENKEITVATGVNALDPISVRIRISGAAASETQLGVLLASAAAQINTWVGQHVVLGFTLLRLR